MSRRRLAIASVAVLLLAGVGLALVPLVGRSLVRRRLLPRAEARLGVPIEVRTVACGYRTVHLYGVRVGAAAGGGASLLAVDEVDVDYRLPSALFGRLRLGEVRVRKPVVTWVRGADGRDDLRPLLERLRRRGGEGSAGGAAPSAVVIDGGALHVRDDADGTSMDVSSIDARLQPAAAGESTISLRGIDGRVEGGPAVAADAVDIAVPLAASLRGLMGLPRVRIAGGRISVLPSLALTGIEGEVNPAPSGARVGIALRGSYGGTPGPLWTADGWLAPASREGELRLRADRFTLDRLASILGGSPFLRPGRTSVDAELALALHGARVDYQGRLSVSGLTVFHPKLAPIPVPDVAFTASGRGSLDLAARRLAVDDAEVHIKDLVVILTASAQKGRGPAAASASQPAAETATAALAPPGNAAAAGDDDEDAPASAPAYLSPWLRDVSFDARLQIPRVGCQRLLDALPAALVPYLRGFKLSGPFDADVRLALDFGALGGLKLGGKVNIWGCRVERAPAAMDAARLASSFEEHVEAEPGKDLAFVVGPENPDFVPLADISPYMVAAVLTTEDGSFLENRGFDSGEFANALRTDLVHGGFRYGASSLTMQMVKNVLLTHDKTLSRKLQELFLTWYLAGALPKERILEIYFNVVELGPGLYGIGPAARRYFGKAAKDLDPLEAAWLTSILPSPKRRYAFYCEGAPSPEWDRYLRRILGFMHDRGRLTDEEYAEWKDAPFAFARDAAASQPAGEERCLAGVDRIVQATAKEAEDREAAWRDRALGLPVPEEGTTITASSDKRPERSAERRPGRRE